MPCGFWLPHIPPIFFADRVSFNSGPSRRRPVWSYGTHRENRFYQLSPHQQSSGTRSPDFCVSAAPFFRGRTSARGLAQCCQCDELCRVACQPRRSPEPFDCAEAGTCRMCPPPLYAQVILLTFDSAPVFLPLRPFQLCRCPQSSLLGPIGFGAVIVAEFFTPGAISH